jgi:hypothetical protein
MKVLMGVGSDDDIKIFLNGTLVHSNWIARATTPDDDIVALDLKKAATLPKYQLIPASATEYFTEEVKARFTFKQDESGKTSELYVNFGGQFISAKKVTRDK